MRRGRQGVQEQLKAGIRIRIRIRIRRDAGVVGSGDDDAMVCKGWMWGKKQEGSKKFGSSNTSKVKYRRVRVIVISTETRGSWFMAMASWSVGAEPRM